MSKEASNIPPDVIHRAHQEMQRGADPEVLAEMGYHVPETSDLRYEDHERVMVKAHAGVSVDGDEEPRLEGHLADPEEDAEWQRMRRAGLSGAVVATNSLTSAQRNANARKAEVAHYRRATGPGGWRQVRHPRSHS